MQVEQLGVLVHPDLGHARRVHSVRVRLGEAVRVEAAEHVPHAGARDGLQGSSTWEDDSDIMNE